MLHFSPLCLTSCPCRILTRRYRRNVAIDVSFTCISCIPPRSGGHPSHEAPVVQPLPARSLQQPLPGVSRPPSAPCLSAPSPNIAVTWIFITSTSGITPGLHAASLHRPSQPQFLFPEHLSNLAHLNVTLILNNAAVLGAQTRNIGS